MTIQPDPISLPIHIRPAQLADASDLQRMCWPERSLDSLQDLLKRAQMLTYRRQGMAVVGIFRGITCGFGLLTLWIDVAEISDLIVHPDYRSQGVGSQIITTLTQVAYDFHVFMLEIGVRPDNGRALALYRRLGFADDRSIEVDLGNGSEPVLYLVKKLDASPNHQLPASPWYNTRTAGSSGSG
jgi:ribosomal protein S18 acetylase RimI-like enzyme